MSQGTIEKQFHQKFGQSRRLYEQAAELFPDSATHDARAMQPFGVYIERGQGSRKWDVQGHEFVDWVTGHGSLLLGHSHPKVVAAVQQQMGRATHPGASHELEVRLPILR